MAILAAAAIGGGLSYLGSRKAAKSAMKSMEAQLAFQRQQINQAIQEISSVDLPPDEALKYVLENPQLVGLEEIPEDLKSEYENLSIDPNFKAQGLEILDSYADRAEQGMSAKGKAELEAGQREAAKFMAATQKSTLQEMAQRGTLGGGAELAARLSGQQAGAERVRQAGTEAAVLSEQARQEGQARRAALLGQLTSQDLAVKQSKASALDRFNLQNRAMKQEIARRNLERQQRQADVKMGLQHETARRGAQIAESQYARRMGKAQAMAGARTGGAQQIASTMSKMGDIQAGRAAAPYQALGQIAGAYGQYAARQPTTTTTTSTETMGNIDDHTGRKDGGVKYADGGPAAERMRDAAKGMAPLSEQEEMLDILTEAGDKRTPREMQELIEDYKEMQKFKKSQALERFPMEFPYKAGIPSSELPTESPTKSPDFGDYIKGGSKEFPYKHTIPESGVPAPKTSTFDDIARTLEKSKLAKGLGKAAGITGTITDPIGTAAEMGLRATGVGSLPAAAAVAAATPSDIDVSSEFNPYDPKQVARQSAIERDEELNRLIQERKGRYEDGGISPEDQELFDELEREEYANGGYNKFGYEEGGEQTEGRLVPGDNYAGDELPDKINSKEMVLNVEQQDRLYDMLKEYARLKEGSRVDRELEEGETEIEPTNQEALMAVLRGEAHPSDLPEGGILDENNAKAEALRGLLS